MSLDYINTASNINIAGYKLDINSRVISFNNSKLKLTERETQIILFLKKELLMVFYLAV